MVDGRYSWRRRGKSPGNAGQIFAEQMRCELPSVRALNSTVSARNRLRGLGHTLCDHGGAAKFNSILRANIQRRKCKQ